LDYNMEKYKSNYYTHFCMKKWISAQFMGVLRIGGKAN